MRVAKGKIAPSHTSACLRGRPGGGERVALLLNNHYLYLVMNHTSASGRRNIRIFISSTFKDMKSERDHLMKKVFPKLQSIAAERNVGVVPLDLRWGITQSEAENGKLLEICLREIDNSRPFFIGILGDRYGWCPSAKELNRNPFLSEEYGAWLTSDINRQLSVTEIEIQYGILRKSGTQHAYFYERPGWAQDVRVKHLKDEIIKDGRYPLKPFSKPEDLGALVEQDFLALLDSLYPQENLSQVDKERLNEQSRLERLREIYLPNPDHFNRLDNFLRGINRELVVYGESGIGKSALVANWLQTISGSYRVVFRSIGLAGVTDSQCIAASISEELSGDQKQSVGASLTKAAEKQPVLLVLDGVDNLSEDDKSKRLRWLEKTPVGAKIIFTTTNKDDTLSAIRLRGAEELLLEPLDLNRRRNLIDFYLANYGKKLSHQQADRIANWVGSANANELKTWLDELISFGVFDQLDQLINYYLSSQDSRDFYRRIIRRKEKDFDSKTVEAALSLIAFSAKGISEAEILAISGCSRLSLSQFLCSFRQHLLVSNGLLSFHHNRLLEAAKEAYSKKETKTREAIIKYFKDTPKASRAIDELPVHYFKLAEERKLYDYITQVGIFAELYRRDLFTLGRYWHFLILKGMNPEVYLSQDWIHDTASAVKYRQAILNGIGYVLFYVANDYSSAKRYFKTSTEIGESASGEDEAKAWFYLARAHADTGEWEEALDAANKAYSILKQIGMGESGLAGNCLSVIASYYSDYKKDKNEGLKVFLTDLQITEKARGSHSLDTILAYYNIGIALCDLKKPDEARYYFDQALTRSLEAVGENDESTANAYYGQGYLAEACGKYDEALDYYKRALKIRESFFGFNHLSVCQTYAIIGTCYTKKGDWSTACDYLNKAMESGRSVGRQGLQYIECAFLLGACEYNLGHKNESIRLFKVCAEYTRKYAKTVTVPTTSAYLSFKLGMMTLYLSGYGEAKPLFEEAVQVWEDNGYRLKEDCGLAYNFIGMYYYATARDYSTAKHYFSEAYSILSAVSSAQAGIASYNLRLAEDALKA